MKVIRCVLAVLASCAALLGLAAPAFARAHLDGTFGGDGVVDLQVRSGSPIALVDVGPGGGILVAIRTPVCPQTDCSDWIYLRRYRPNGGLNRGFGVGSWVNAGVTDGNAALAVDSAGRPLVALQVGDGVAIKRFKANGRPDRSFGESGSALVPCYCTLHSLKIGPDDKPLLIAAADLEPLEGRVWVMARLRSDGLPDRGFGSDGIARHPMPGFYAPEAAVEPSGRVLLYGDRCCRFPAETLVHRMSTRGRLQPKYTAAAKRTLRGVDDPNLSPDASAVVLRPNGRVEIFFRGFRRNAVVRLLPNGKRDPGFGPRGAWISDFIVEEAIPDKRGGTLVTGFSTKPGIGGGMMRLRQDGRFDRNFGLVSYPDNGGTKIVPQGPRSALVIEYGLSGCRQSCPPAEPKLFRIVDPVA